MSAGKEPEGLKLTEEEAYSLLGLCLTSPMALDPNSEAALRKLAEYCSIHSHLYHRSLSSQLAGLQTELEKAEA